VLFTVEFFKVRPVGPLETLLFEDFPAQAAPFSLVRGNFSALNAHVHSPKVLAFFVITHKPAGVSSGREYSIISCYPPQLSAGYFSSSVEW
jgi:hypothetical protein